MFLRRLFSSSPSQHILQDFTAGKLPTHGFRPEAIQETLNGIPYFVARTKLGKSLPVYIDTKRGGNKILTIVRRIYGEPYALAAELKAVLPEGTEIMPRPEMQQIVVKGFHLDTIRAFLTFRGF